MAGNISSCLEVPELHDYEYMTRQKEILWGQKKVHNNNILIPVALTDNVIWMDSKHKVTFLYIPLCVLA